MNPEADDLSRKNARVARLVFLTVAAMIGLAFASVPLYRAFCQLTGFGGTTQRGAELPDHVVDRTVSVLFNADISNTLDWSFKPEQRRIDVKVGQKGIAAYRAHNLSGESLTGTAVYNVTPGKAGKYFHKIQCFCFGEQTLKAGEDVSMPVLFYIDPAFADDIDMQDVKSITLSYTFFRTQSRELDAAVDRFMRQPADDTPIN